MKKIAFTLITLLTQLLNAQDVGRVIIKNGANTYPDFIISINGVRQSNNYSSNISFNYLDETNYRIKVLQSGSSSVLTFMLASAPNYISKYMITKDNYGNYGLILESKALMTAADEIITTQTVITTNTVIPAPTQTLVVIPTPTIAATPTVAAIPTITLASTPTIEILPIPMNEVEYAGVITTLKKESLENGRMAIAKTFFEGKNLTSVQVTGILKQFYLEKNRLEMAKFLYAQTIDKQNYFKTFEVLSLSSSKKDLAEFIKAKK